MPNFDARIRFDYRGVDGLVIDLRSGGMVDDGNGNVESWQNEAPIPRALQTGTHDGLDNASVLTDTTKTWRVNQLRGAYVYNLTDGSNGQITANTENTVTATLANGAGNDWDIDDQYEITTFSVSDAEQPTEANRPTLNIVDGFQQADFTSASSHFLQMTVARELRLRSWTLACEFYASGGAAANRTVFGCPNVELMRGDASSDVAYRYGLATFPGTGDMGDGEWVLAPTAASAATLYQNNAVEVSGGSGLVDIIAGDPEIFIGCLDGVSKFVDMGLRGLQFWNRRLSPLEVDFIYHTLHTETGYASEDRCTMVWRLWTDVTSPTYGAQGTRVNSARNAPQYFLLGQQNGSAPRIQIGCSVNGDVVPDTELGGDLFDIVPMEYPGINPPVVHQDAGWSAIFDVEVVDIGHYTLQVQRDNGGSIILHVDVGILPEVLIWVWSNDPPSSIGPNTYTIEESILAYGATLGPGDDIVITEMKTFVDSYYGATVATLHAGLTDDYGDSQSSGTINIPDGQTAIFDSSRIAQTPG